MLSNEEVMVCQACLLSRGWGQTIKNHRVSTCGSESLVKEKQSEVQQRE